MQFLKSLVLSFELLECYPLKTAKDLLNKLLIKNRTGIENFK